MEAFGINETLVAGFQMNFPAGANMMIYTFDSTPPTNFADMGFGTSATDLISNCSNALLANISYPSPRELQLTHRSAIIKGGDLIASYKGEQVAVYESGVVTGNSFADHVVYSPKSFVCKGDWRDHRNFQVFSYKMGSDEGFTGTGTYINIHTDTNETINYEYPREIEVNCFGIKQNITANMFMRQFVLEYWDSVEEVWTEIITSVLNVNGYQIIKFAAVTSDKFRIRKLASGAAGSAYVSFAYFGKFDFAPEDLAFNMAVPKWAIVTPDMSTTAGYNSLQERMLDMYGNNTVITEDFCIMVDCSDLLGSGRLRINPPAQAQIDYKFDYYLAFGQLF